MSDARNNRYEIWSLNDSGEPRLHGHATGLTFDDACKQLACDSLDFWRHYKRGSYAGHKLYASRDAAVAG